MFDIFRRKNKVESEKTHTHNESVYPQTISGTADEKRALLKQLFQEDELINFREISIGKEQNISVILVSCNGLTDVALIDNHLIRPLMKSGKHLSENLTADFLLSETFELLNIQKTNETSEIVEGVLGGDTLVIMSGIDECLLFETKGFEPRAIAEPEGEKILSGPREGFTESIIQNLSMVRRKIKSQKLKVKFVKAGTVTNTKISVAYIDGIVKPEVLTELMNRLEKIDIDGVLDANYINELIRDQPWSPFRSTGYTERPDVVAAKLLEGRVAIFTDGTPVVLTVPYLFIENFQSNEDYYLNFITQHFPDY